MRKLLGTVALIGMLFAPGMVQAQTVVGPAAAYITDGGGAFGIGAYASIPMPQLHENISITPNFIYFFPDFGDYWELNGDVIYRFPVAEDASVLPFALAGLSIRRSSTPSFTIATVTVPSLSATDVGLNLGGGVAFPMESVRPSVGAKFEIGDGSQFVLFSGVGFPVGS
jgi:hypothetical protein